MANRAVGGGLLARACATVVLVAGCFTAAAVVVPQAPDCTDPVQVGNDQVTYKGVRYNWPQPGQSTWYYSVESGAKPAISHVVFELACPEVLILDAGTWDGTDQDKLKSKGGSPDPSTWPAKPDLQKPTEAAVGLKFDLGFEEGEVRHYYFTVNDNYAVGSILFVSKGGNKDGGFDIAYVCGPSPDCLVVVDELGSLGNQVWHDRNNNGQVDVSEEGLDGVEVWLLFDADNNGTFEGAELTAVQMTTTANGGFYLFEGLVAGKYMVVIPQSNFAIGGGLEKYPLSSTTTNEDPITEANSVDDDDNGIQPNSGGAWVYSPVITLGQPEQNLTVDFGFVDPSIGNLVWRDDNRNGRADEGEPGIQGVKLELFDAADTGFTTVLQTVFSDANGFYFFTGLSDGSYVVRIPEENFDGGPLEDLARSTSPRVNLDNEVDDDNNGLQLAAGMEVISPVIVLMSGTEPVDSGTETGRGKEQDNTVGDANADLTIDFGFVQPGIEEDPEDWGDLPSPKYPTLSTENGPRHVVGDLRLGTLIDAELDGQPTASADGDDLDLNGDDEDGVVFPGSIQRGATINIAITSSGAGTVNAFIDWNNNGTLNDADETYTLVFAAAGTQNLTLIVPANAVVNQLLGARFRLSSLGGLGPVGPATDGEVEDYLITVTAPPTAARLAHFTASSRGAGQVELSWGTLVETGVLGFRAERRSVAGVWERLPGAMVPATGWNGQPQRYGWLDSQASGLTGLSYRLVEVSLTGRESVVAETTVVEAVQTALVRSSTGLGLKVVGTAGAGLVVESAPSITGPWTAVGTLVLDGRGAGTVNLGQVGGEPAQFYRVVSE